MNKDCIIYESVSDEISENNIQLAEKMIIEKLQQKSCRRVIVRPKIKVGKDILMLTASVVITILFLFLVHSIFHILNNASGVGNNIEWSYISYTKNGTTYYGYAASEYIGIP